MFKKKFSINGKMFELHCDSYDIFKKQSEYLDFDILNESNIDNESQSVTKLFVRNNHLLYDKYCAIVKNMPVYAGHTGYNKENYNEYRLNNKTFFFRDNLSYFLTINSDKDKIEIFMKDPANMPYLSSFIMREILIRKLEDDGKIFFHSAGFAIDDEGCLIVGESGAGKTTLLFKLMEAFDKSSNFSFISNDRTFLEPGIESFQYFPCPISLRVGTIKGNNKLRDYLSVAVEQKKSNEDKIGIQIKEMKSIFDNISINEEASLKRLIVPQINFSEDNSVGVKRLQADEVKDIVNKCCLTPFDTDANRYQWIFQRTTPEQMLIEGANKMCDNIAQSIPTYLFSYNKNSTPKQIKDAFEDLRRMEKNDNELCK